MLHEIVREESYEQALRQARRSQLVTEGIEGALDYALGYDPLRFRNHKNGYYSITIEASGIFPAFTALYRVDTIETEHCVTLIHIVFVEPFS
jgi:hypothetical protein